MNRARDRQAQPGDTKAKATRAFGVPKKDRRARVADRADALEPGHALKVETARLDRPRGRRQMTGQNYDLTDFRGVVRLIPMQ